MKQLLVQQIEWNNPKVEELMLQFDKAAVPFHRIDTVNWKSYP